MPICTLCGTITNKDDTGHICDPVNIPAPGKEKVPDTKEKDK